MCMQPWFFSIGRWHFGQGFVFANIQLRFSLSALFLVIHLLTVSHVTCSTHKAPTGPFTISPSETKIAYYMLRTIAT